MFLFYSNEDLKFGRAVSLLNSTYETILKRQSCTVKRGVARSLLHNLLTKTTKLVTLRDYGGIMYEKKRKITNK